MSISGHPAVDARKEERIRFEAIDVSIDVWPRPICCANDAITRVRLGACGSYLPYGVIDVSAPEAKRDRDLQSAAAQKCRKRPVGFFLSFGESDHIVEFKVLASRHGNAGSGNIPQNVRRNNASANEE